MTRHKKTIVFVVGSFFFIILAEIFQLKMFSDKIEDGFYSQINYISSSFGNADTLISPLYLIHAMRLLAVLPFFVCDAFDLPSYMEAIFFIVYLLPFMKCKRSFIFSYMPIIFLFLPFLFSYRAVLGMIGMLYLYLCLFYEKGNYRLVLASALLVNLSSGIVLAWVIAIAGSYKYIKWNYKHLIPIFGAVILGFLGSILNKYEYMFSVSGAEEHGSALQRSTLYVSYVCEQYFRLGSYIFIIFLVCFILALELFKDSCSARKWIFFFGAVPTMFFEGLGLVSYLFCILIYLYNDVSLRIFGEKK